MLQLKHIAGAFWRGARIVSRYTTQVGCQTPELRSLHMLSSSIATRGLTSHQAQLTTTSASFLSPVSLNVDSVRSYKIKGQLQLRCADCYFIKRHGELYVECKTKKRHRQKQLIARHKQFKHDYTEGRFKNMVYAKYKEDRFYRKADPYYVKFDWLGDRFCTEV